MMEERSQKIGEKEEESGKKIQARGMTMQERNEDENVDVSFLYIPVM